MRRELIPPKRDDAELLETRLIGMQYGRLQSYTFRHRRFDGSWSGPVTRDCFDSGPAAILMPYDPVRDEIVLIRQFRASAWVVGQEPLIYEFPAGRIDKEGKTAREIAVAEAREEAGLEVMQVEKIGGFFASPGIFTEYLTAYCGRVANAQGGNFGLAEENEDIRAEVHGASEAIAMAERGEITSGPTLLCLYWLALHRERLRAEWR